MFDCLWPLQQQLRDWRDNIIEKNNNNGKRLCSIPYSSFCNRLLIWLLIIKLLVDWKLCIFLNIYRSLIAVSEICASHLFTFEDCSVVKNSNNLKVWYNFIVLWQVLKVPKTIWWSEIDATQPGYLVTTYQPPLGRWAQSRWLILPSSQSACFLLNSISLPMCRFCSGSFVGPSPKWQHRRRTGSTCRSGTSILGDLGIRRKISSICYFW